MSTSINSFLSSSLCAEHSVGQQRVLRTDTLLVTALNLTTLDDPCTPDPGAKQTAAGLGGSFIYMGRSKILLRLTPARIPVIHQLRDKLSVLG